MLSSGREGKSLRRLEEYPYGFDSKSGSLVSRSTGTETCSCTMSQLPLILRYTSVTRTVRSIGSPFASVPLTCWMEWAPK